MPESLYSLCPDAFNHAGRGLLAGLDADSVLYQQHLQELHHLDAEAATLIESTVSTLERQTIGERDRWLASVAKDLAPFFPGAALALGHRVLSAPTPLALLAELEALALYYAIPVEEDAE